MTSDLDASPGAHPELSLSFVKRSLEPATIYDRKVSVTLGVKCSLAWHKLGTAQYTIDKSDSKKKKKKNIHHNFLKGKKRRSWSEQLMDSAQRRRVHYAQTRVYGPSAVDPYL